MLDMLGIFKKSYSGFKKQKPTILLKIKKFFNLRWFGFLARIFI